MSRRRLIWSVLAIAAVVALLGVAPHDQALGRRLVAAALAREALAQLPLPPPPAVRVANAELPAVSLQLSGPTEIVAEVKRTVVAARGFRTVEGPGRQRLVMRCLPFARELRLEATLSWPAVGGAAPVRWTGTRRWATSWSLLPPLIAIVLALVTRRVLAPIGAGVFTGALVHLWLAPTALGSGWARVLHFAGTPLLAAWRTFAHYLWEAATSPFSLYVIGFTFALCGMVGLAGYAGGNRGIVRLVSRIATDGRRTRLATGLMGLAIFFEDYANAIVVGQTARPLTDAHRVSREKLAYLVDSTAAPVAGIALISTWIGWEAGLFQGVSDELGLTLRGYQIFVAAVPFRFYCFFTLILLFASTLLRVDFGPMLRAERRAFHTGQLWREGASVPLTHLGKQLEAAEHVGPRWWVTGVPVLLLLASVIGGMVWDGSRHPSVAALPVIWTWEYVRLCFAHGDNGPVLLGAAIIGSLCAMALARMPFVAAPRLVKREGETSGSVGQQRLPAGELLRAWFWGGWVSLPALAILISAKALQGTCDDLSTSAFLVALAGHGVPPWLLPVATFLLASAVAFATGTSWGTMGILIPSVGPLAYHVGGAELMLVVLASILDGAIFGDHCSPISDTTIMSSLSSRCDHLDHVRTQMPYALTAMLVAAGAGYLGVSIGLTPLGALFCGGLAIVVILLVVGRDPEKKPA